MSNKANVVGPENTAARVALWRALHVQSNPPPHVLVDDIGIRLVAPEPEWEKRPDMSPFTKPFRASNRRAGPVHRGSRRGACGARRRSVHHPRRGSRYVRAAAAGARRTRARVQIDQPGPQAWKQQRLLDLEYGIPAYLKFVPVDFEAGEVWLERLVAAGFESLATRGRRVDGREHVSHARGNRRDVARDRDARRGLDTRDDVHAAESR